MGRNVTWWRENQGSDGGLTVETVWMPEGDERRGGGWDARRTPKRILRRRPRTGSARQESGDDLCFQPGRLRGELPVLPDGEAWAAAQSTAGEIAGQVVAVLDRHSVEVGKDRVNLVFMGMGEPFLNYDNFMAAVRLLVEEVGISPQRMTVSTSGIVPGIERFAEEPPEVRPKLAISLNAPNDEIRSEVMPINRKWPIEAVVDAVRAGAGCVRASGSRLSMCCWVA